MNNFLKDPDYLRCNFKERVAGLIDYAQTKLWTNISEPLFRIIPSYRRSSDLGIHSGDCIKQPQTCFCCAYHSLMCEYYSQFPLFLMVGHDYHDNIIKRYYNINHNNEKAEVPIERINVDKMNAEILAIYKLLEKHNIFKEYNQILKGNLNRL